MKPDCKGCNALDYIPEEYVIYKNDKILINHYSGFPHALGHVIVQPRSKCVEELADLSKKEDAIEILAWVWVTCKAMKDALKDVERIYICSFNEDRDWHLHFHLVPRYRYEKNKGPDLLNQELKCLPEVDKIKIAQRIHSSLIKEADKHGLLPVG